MPETMRSPVRGRKCWKSQSPQAKSVPRRKNSGICFRGVMNILSVFTQV